MTIRKPIPPIKRFDERDPNKVPLYPFPWPNGLRCIAITNGKTVNLYECASGKTDTLLDGFAPHIEEALCQLYSSLYSEPDRRYTRNGVQVTFPMHAFDLMLFDRGNGGHADNTNQHLDEWLIDPDWPVSPKVTCALVITHMPAELFMRGSDVVDLWQRRADLHRALGRLGMTNPYATPAPVLQHMTIAPLNWDRPMLGNAGNDSTRFWNQVNNCFSHGYAGCMVIDVWQPWAVNGDAFQLITEEDVI